MLTEEETRYYEWLGRFYSGAGAAIEIGCWLGHSTWHIVAGLLRNPSFAGRRLHVFDAFVWQAYMNAFLPDAHPAAGASFRALFDHHTSPIRAHLDVATCTLVPGYGDGTVPLFSWHGGPIELCWVDCGKSHEANEAWFTTVSPSFLSDRTLIVLQDWGNHRTGTSPADTGIKAFTDAHAANLELVHELRQGAVGTFLFRRPT
jgi:hypothetical protein